ncbi:NUDIX domain-containing protein [Candidatus Saccharibacteria bacterium]|nr:NUDIX domain-containing protein [Candidatus Saccharibacteria bacterium]
MSNTEKRFRTIAAVLVLLSRKNANGNTEYLLQKRQNTGFADGMWDFSTAGHVEKNEPMIKTVCRETKEEIGINVDPNDIDFMGLLHSFGEDGEPRFLGCFRVKKYTGNIEICEPEKIAELKWFSEESLPDNMIASRRKALEKYLSRGIFYQELGWNK